MELKNIDYKINDKIILNNINTNFTSEGINLIIGPNGSGKSTMLKLLYQINKPTNGEIIFKNIKESSEINKYTAYLGQYNSIFHKVDLLYFLKLNRYIKTGSLNLDNYTNWIIDLFSLEKFLNQSLISLSGGERQRAILASIFLLEKKYILLDEPFSFLDISSKLELSKIIEKNFSDKILIIVTHNLNIFKNVKKTLALKNGEIFFDGINIGAKELEKLFDIQGSNYFTHL
jgi:iron complex transport system ATP-binding protein